MTRDKHGFWGRLWQGLLTQTGMHPGIKVKLTGAVFAKTQPDGWVFNFVETYRKYSNEEFERIVRCMEDAIDKMDESSVRLTSGETFSCRADEYQSHMRMKAPRDGTIVKTGALINFLREIRSLQPRK